MFRRRERRGHFTGLGSSAPLGNQFGASTPIADARIINPPEPDGAALLALAAVALRRR